MKIFRVEEKGGRIDFAVLFKERKEKRFTGEFFFFPMKVSLLILGVLSESICFFLKIDYMPNYFRVKWK